MSDFIEMINIICASVGLSILVIEGNEWWNERQEEKKNKRK